MCGDCITDVVIYHHYICGTKQQLEQETHLCHLILDLGQDKATARYGYHSSTVILTRRRTMESFIYSEGTFILQLISSD